MKLKIAFVVLVTGLCGVAFADGPVEPLSTITYEYGYGTGSGFCDGQSAWYCVDQIERRAKDDAVRDARWKCEMRRGKADTFMASCNEHCNPSYIAPDARSQYVTCTANCSVRCEIP